jgi:hypothetical protein
MFKAALNLPRNSELTGLGGRQSIKSVLTNKRGISASLPEVIGAVTISVILIGGSAFGLAAGYNASQDADAKSTLNAVKSAQVLNQSKTEGYGTFEELTTGEDPALTANPDKLKIEASTTNYCAVVKSGSMFGATYWMTAKSGKVLEKAPTAAEAGVTCPAF